MIGDSEVLSLERKLEADGVRFVHILFTDLLGELRNIEIPIGHLTRAVNNGISFDGSSIGGYATISDADMYLEPDLATLAVYPNPTSSDNSKKNYAVAGVIADVFTASGDSFSGDPRSVLSAFIKQATESGIKLYIGAELEFFLFPEGNIPLSSSQITSRSGYFSLSPVDKEEVVRREIVLELLEMGIEVEASHHEIVPHIHEIDFEYGNPIATADRLMMIKFVAKSVAQANGMQAVFMPKPVSEFAASGMHVHVSLFHDGNNLFYDPSDDMGLSSEARWFIGGLINHLGAVTAFTNPTINSYKRLIPGYEAPVNVAWASKNRSALIRIPATNTPEKATRFELRSPDPSANPYLAFTAILAAGLDGVEHQIAPPDPIKEDIYSMDEEEKASRGIKPLPTRLEDTIEMLVSDQTILSALGNKVCDYYIRAKKEEIASFRRTVTDWERDRYQDI